MIEPLDWKMGKFIEWCTHLPYENRPVTSPVFLIKNTYCYFHLSRSSNKYYYLYLNANSATTELESFSLTIFYNFNEFNFPATFYRHCEDFKDSEPIFSFDEFNFSSRKPNLSRGFSVRFVFTVDENIEFPYLLDNKTEEKSTQADLLTSLNTDVEYLSFDFGELLKNGIHSDVQMLCNGGTIPAHKAVLAARSKVFSEMFQNNTEENKSGLINMTTTEKSVMELCLEFIYQGKIVNLPTEKASNLYVLGHVLKISSLTKVCADLMICSLSEGNYVPCLVLADKYNDDYFKCGVTEYISDHAYLLKTEDWMTFSNEHLKAANDVYKKCMLKFI